jgi:hypothetical protein
MVSELDFKSKLLLEYLRNQVQDENQPETFEINQKNFDFDNSIGGIGSKNPEVRDLIRQITSGKEMGEILDHLSEITNGEFKLVSIAPTRKVDSTEPIELDFNTTLSKSLKLKPATTQWSSGYNAWTVEYHPEKKHLQKKVLDNKRVFNFYINKDRELIQILPGRQEKLVKVTQKQYALLELLSEHNHSYVKAKDIAEIIGSPIKYVQNSAQMLKKEIDKNFLGITGKEFIESDDGYRISRKVNLEFK